MFYRLAAILVILATPAAAEPESEILYTSESFVIECTDETVCGKGAGARFPKLGKALVDQMEAGVVWLEELGFPELGESDLETVGNPEKRKLRLQVDTEHQEPKCDEVACHIKGILDAGRIILPLENADRILASSDTLAHEYVHSIQKSGNPRKLDWIVEGVATAVGYGYAKSRGAPLPIYPPSYRMTLDRPFYDVGDPGYGNWPYLHQVGDKIGSRGSVAYLSNPKILEIRLNAALNSEGNMALDFEDAATGMHLFYDRDIVGKATFDKVFPDYVAHFNNVEESSFVGSAYEYYQNIRFEAFTVPTTAEKATAELTDTVKTYAATPILVKLDVTPEPEVEPKDTLMMVKITLTDKTADGLGLVVEHGISDKPKVHMAMIDGSNTADELGFLRVVNAPSAYSGKTGVAEFTIEFVASPIALTPPSCAQVSKPFVLTPEGFLEEDAKNWTLKTNNGTVEGLTVTPSHAGSMKLTLKIESLVTRGSSGVNAVKPKATTVDLGTFKVQSKACMVRLTVKNAVVTYSVDGAYSEFKSRGGEAIYFSANDFIAFDGKWRSIPAQMKGMILGRMKQNNPFFQFGYLTADGNAGDFMHQMPYIFSQRFTWSRIKRIPAADGTPLRRKPAGCPAGYGSGCSTVTFVTAGQTVPILYDTGGRPITVGFGSVDVRFEYGVFDIRRPPGW